MEMLSFKRYLSEARLSKTEKDLIDRAHNHPQKMVSLTHEISHKPVKNRELEAAHGLVKRGHLKHVSSAGSRDREKKSKASKTRSYITSVFRLNELSVPQGATGKRKEVSTPMVAIRMASGKIEKHPPGKSGSSGGGGSGGE
jgi:hypothetical protein